MSVSISIENFSHRYPDGTESLSGINLKIKKGEKVALIGPNGAGKSSLLLGITGFLKGSGKIYVNNLELSKPNMKKIRQMMGIVMQNPDDQLFMPTLFDDIAFGPLNMGMDNQQVKLTVQNALYKVGLSGLADKEPHHLSAGQKRRAAIATILSMNPEIIIMDEPEANLDPGTRKKLTELIKKMSETIIIATCNMDFAADICQRAVLINYGKVIADGDTKTTMSDENLMLNNDLEVPRIFS